MNETVKKIFCNSRVKTAAVALPLIILLLASAPKWIFFILLLGLLSLLVTESWTLFRRLFWQHNRNVRSFDRSRFCPGSTAF